MLSHELAQVQANFAHRNQNSKVMKRKKIFFKECHLAGRQYHDANEVWEELKVGTLLELQRDQENPYDKNAVAVVYSKVVDNNEKEEYLLGYLPRTSNTEIAQLLEMGGHLSLNAASARSTKMPITRTKFA